MRTIVFLSALLLSISSLSAQEKVRYTEDFRFARGIYLTLDDWKANQPLRPEEVIGEADPASPKFFQFLLSKEQFRFARNNEIVYVNISDIFGYCDGRDVFHRKQYRFELIGQINLLEEVDVVDSYSSFINPGEQYQATRAEGAGKLFVLDYETGNFFRCKPKQVEALFQRDPQLFGEYKKAKGKKKEKIRNFIKEYNFRHPVYFPRGEL